jgi:hyperosmotically inducible periplasmic protein
MRTTGGRWLRRTGGLALAAALLWAAPARADETAPGRSDVDLGDAVFHSVIGYHQYGVFDSVGYRVENGVVTLSGSVRHPWRKDEIGRRVARLDGVKQLKNEIRVQPVSTFDDRLRTQLFHRIYGDGLFVRFAHSADPPVRIIVENGNITLTGVVNSTLEKVKLETLARGVMAFRVDNQVQVENEKGKEPAKHPTAS